MAEERASHFAQRGHQSVAHLKPADMAEVSCAPNTPVSGCVRPAIGVLRAALDRSKVVANASQNGGGILQPGTPSQQTKRSESIRDLDAADVRGNNRDRWLCC